MTADRSILGMYSFFTSHPRRLAQFWAHLVQLQPSAGATGYLVMLDLDHEVAATTWIFERVDRPAQGAAPIALDAGSAAEDP